MSKPSIGGAISGTNAGGGGGYSPSAAMAGNAAVGAAGVGFGLKILVVAFVQ